MTDGQTDIALRRSREDRVLLGLLGGLAGHFQIDALRLRLVVAVVSLLAGVIAPLLIYLLLCWIVPADR